MAAPSGHSSHPLRRLSVRRTLRDAVADALELPENDVLREPLDDMLQRLEIELRNNVAIEDEDRMNQLEAKYQTHVKQCRDKGRNEGRAEGLRLAVIDLCEAFAVDLSPERRAYIESIDLANLDDLRAQLKQQRAWPGS